MVGALPGEFASLLGSSLGMIRPDPVKTAQLTVKQALESLCLMLRDHAYLCGEQPTLADFAVAGMTLALKVPGQQYVELPAGLCGQGIPGLADDVNYQAFFDWRDRLYTDYRQRRDDIGGDDIS